MFLQSLGFGGTQDLRPRPLDSTSSLKDRTMNRRHLLSFTERRRASLAKKVDRLDRLETRNTMTEPISVTALSVSALRSLVQLGIMSVGGGNHAVSQAVREASQRTAGLASSSGAGKKPFHGLSIPIGMASPKAAPGGGGGASEAEVAPPPKRPQADDWLNLSAPSSSTSDPHGISTPWHPIARAGGGAALPPRGGSGGPSAAKTSTRGVISPLRLPPSTPGASNAAGSAALLAALASSSASNAAAANAEVAVGAPARAAAAGSSSQSTLPGQAPVGSAPSPTTGLTAAPLTSSGGSTSASSIPVGTRGNFSGPSQLSFPYFPLYVLDNNNGVVLFPGVQQQATLYSEVDLIAQVSGTTVSSYSWNTTNLTAATNISGTSTYQLTFMWNEPSVVTSETNSVTLSVTDTNSHIETYTYDFFVPKGADESGTGTNATWPGSLGPDQVILSAPSFQSQSNDATVDATSGALDTQINLPTYNPNVPALALTYDSLTANSMPIIIVENTLSPSGTVPSQVSAQLTFDGTALTTYYYNTSTLNPGDVQQIALQATNATSLATGRYAYTATIVDHGTSLTTITLSGSATVINQSTDAFGDGWTLQGLEQITPASGGVILNEGDNGRSLWFTGSFGSGGGTYTDPQGEFSTLVLNSNGSYTQTLTNGIQIAFNSSGYETSTIDLNGLHTTFSYNGSNQLTSLTDPYSNVTTFSYSGGYLQSITDPASRITTFTHSGANLTQATLPDNSTWGYTYSSGQLTQITDPRSNLVTISYDSAERVGTITLPDATSEEFTNDQESGWTNSGTSGSPAAATLLAQATSTYTSPNGNTTTLRPDWWGMGVTGVQIDPLGDVTTFDLNSNGLATVAIDPLNLTCQFTYDSHGNVTEQIHPDGTTVQATYNSYAEPLTSTDENGNTTSYTYDSHGNNTVIQDPLHNLTTMTYTSDGKLQTVTDANNHTTTYLYDSQDRVTTVVNPDGTTVKYAYNSQGNVTSVTDERGNTTTFSYDAMNRETGTTDPLNDITTYTYDSGGNLIKDQEPTPAGQTARTTTYAYDSMDRLTTVTDPLGNQTIYAYDGDRNVTSVTDPMGRITTTMYDALDRPTVVIDPMGNRTTTTYDADGNVIQVVDPLGRITTVGYDSRGWVGPMTDPLTQTTTYSYTPTGQTASVKNPAPSGGDLDVYTYNADDELIAATDPNNNTTTYGYDAVGNQITVTDANNNTTTYAYDSTNELTTITDPMGDTTVYGYDANGNQITVTDGLGHTTTTLYDALNRVTTMISAVGGTTTITYDAAGRESSLTDPDGNETQWAYDADDRVATMTLPIGSTATYVYDKDGELVDTTDEDGRRTTYSYNADGDETGETWLTSSGGALDVITYSYDADNELTGARDSYATLTFTYDSGGNQLTAATSGPGAGQPSVTLTSGYNAQNMRTTLSDNLTSSGITTFTYDAAERLTEVASTYGGTAGPQVVYTHDQANRLTSESRTIASSDASVNTTYSYDAANRQTTITDWLSVTTSGSGGGTTITPLATYVYSYDEASRVTSEKDAEGTTSFTYDNANELTGVTGSQSASYTYDLNGNQTGTGYTTATDDEQTASPGYTYTYDNAGNLIAETNTSTHVVTTYTYDYGNRLTEVTQGGTIAATYTYDALNNRIGIDDSGTQTWTVYDGTNPYADFNSSGALKARYQFGPGVVDGAVVDEILARTTYSSGSGGSGTTPWYLADKLGSVRDIVSSSGTELDHIVYDSFGNILSETNATNGDRFKYAGMEYDSVTGQYYDRARYYDQATGRFSSQDPLGFGGGELNLYQYVGNDPTCAVDPTGLQGSGGGAASADEPAQGAPKQSPSPPKISGPTNAVGTGGLFTRYEIQFKAQQQTNENAQSKAQVASAQQAINTLRGEWATVAAQMLIYRVGTQNYTAARAKLEARQYLIDNAASIKNQRNALIDAYEFAAQVRQRAYEQDKLTEALQANAQRLAIARELAEIQSLYDNMKHYVPGAFPPQPTPPGPNPNPSPKS